MASSIAVTTEAITSTKTGMRISGRTRLRISGYGQVGGEQHQRGGEAQAQAVDRAGADRQQGTEPEQLHQPDVVAPQAVCEMTAAGGAHCWPSLPVAESMRSALAAGGRGKQGIAMLRRSIPARFTHGRTTARGVTVAPVNWSKAPPSRCTAQPVRPGRCKERPVKPRIQSLRSGLDLVAEARRFPVADHAHAGQPAVARDADQQSDGAAVAAGAIGVSTAATGAWPCRRARYTVAGSLVPSSSGSCTVMASS